MKLSVLFEPPFWVALVEDERNGLLYAARHVFGAEPSSENIYEFILSPKYTAMIRGMTVGISHGTTTKKRINPKRLQRQIRKEKARTGITNQSWDAMRVQQEANKKERQTISKQEQTARRNYKRELAKQKKKQKHRGR